MARMLRGTGVGVAPARSIELSGFKGIDLSSSVTEVKPYRSPNAPNMMPDIDGFPVKRTGYEVKKVMPYAVNGAHRFETTDENGMPITTELIHAGTNLYKDDEQTPIYTTMSAKASTSFQIQNKLMIIDGASLLIYDGEQVKRADDTEVATIPLVTISRSPSGAGAKSYKPVNLLTPWVTDSFLAEAGVAQYHLSFSGLGAGEIKVEMLDVNGVWQAYTPAPSVNRQTGVVTFSTAPPLSPVTGEDNVRITYEKGTSGKDKINGCTLGILYGQSGTPDRLWLSGNPKHRGVDWHSEFEDPTFFGDLSYANVGNADKPVMGYATMGSLLVTFKQNEENNRNVFIRSAMYDKESDEWEFPFTTVIEADGALGAIGSLNNEPIYLTKNGIYAVALQDGTSGERYTQSRGYYLQGGLAKEKNLEKAKAICFGRYFGIAVNGKLYLLDKEQKSYNPNTPHSAYQYEAYLWNNIPARVLWERDGKLCFGTEVGEVMQFMQPGTGGAYSDRRRKNPVYVEGGTDGIPEYLGDAIVASWATPLMALSGYSHYKTIKNVWVVGQPYGRTGGDIFYATDKEYEKFKRSYTADIFDFNDIDFNRFTFNTLDRPSIIPVRRKERKAKLIQVMARSTALDEAFGILAIVIEYREGGRIKT